MALKQLQTWQDYSTNTLYIKQTAIPLYATQSVELFPGHKTTLYRSLLTAQTHRNIKI